MPDVTYTLLVNGSPAEPAVASTIQQLQVEDHALKPDMFRLRALVSVRENDSGWTILDDDVFPRLTIVEVRLKVGTAQAQPLIKAYVIESSVSFSNTPGKSYLDVVAMDPTVLMALDEKVRAWPNMSYSDIANAIFGDYGFTPDVDTTPVNYEENDTTVTQRGTDIQFLQQLAKRAGFECYVELNDSTGAVEGHFHKPRLDQTPQGVLSVNLGGATNVNSFSARFDMLRPVQAQATSLDVESQQSQDGQADTTSLKTLGSGAALDPNKPRTVLISQSGLTRTSELQDYAQAVVDRSAFAILAEGELNTTAYGAILQAKRAVNVRGAGQQFSGIYYVDRVLHTFTGNGYVQKFSMRRNALGLGGQENFTEDNALPN
jgi:phage protein D